MEHRTDAALAADVMAGLREEQRRALQLSVLYGMTHAGVAQSMGIPLGRAKTHVRNAVAKVRERLLFPREPASS